MRSIVPILLWTGAAAFGQTAPAFEVASIKSAPPLTRELMRSGQFRMSMTVDKARAEYIGIPLSRLIAAAYRVKPVQVSGPDWMNVDRFDIVAKMPQGASPEQAPEMLQALLAERFHLQLRQGSRKFGVYALVVAKSGPKFTVRPADYHPADNPKNTHPMTMESYAAVVADAVGWPVVNQTGLKGEYLLSLDVMKKLSVINAQGLKLQSRRLPMPFLVLEHVEEVPTEN